jgi:hypothetical protein
MLHGQSPVRQTRMIEARDAGAIQPVVAALENGVTISCK